MSCTVVAETVSPAALLCSAKNAFQILETSCSFSLTTDRTMTAPSELVVEVDLDSPATSAADSSASAAVDPPLDTPAVFNKLICLKNRGGCSKGTSLLTCDS